MKKLKNKVFYTIFLIFTFFSILFVFVFNYSNYKNEVNIIKSVLTNNATNKDELSKRIYVNLKAYTIFFNNNNINLIISHNDNNNSTKEIVDVVTDILNTGKLGIHINNLYFSNYSYNLSNGVLILVDNTTSKVRLNNSFYLSILMFIFYECIILIISYYLTKNITHPVIETFEKQKSFIADASHELKTPISVIMASADAMNVSKNNVKFLDNIKFESDRMSNLVMDLLDLSKSENIDKNKNYSIIDLSKLVNKEILTFEALAFENNVTFENNVSDNIEFNCDENDLNKLVGILLDNAIKHSYKDTSIIVNLSKNKDDIILTVSNTGDEISKDDCQKIFERFYKIDKSRNRNDNHYGLGLAIAKNIVTSYNGIIGVSSMNNVTIFKVIFKCRRSYDKNSKKCN